MLTHFVKNLLGTNAALSLPHACADVWSSWLVPFPGEHPCGRDPGYEDAFFELKDEAAKLTGIDDALIVRSCEQLITGTGKDLRVAGHYTFARLRQHGPAGFADGLELIATLVERFDAALLPARAETKKGVNHLWLDLQYFQHSALDRVGAPHNAWRELLRADFALFLERLPGIERLAFNDGTPFADDTTLEWIARHAVVRDLEAGERVAPLSVSAESKDGAAGDWPEIEAQARDLAASQSLEAAFAWLESLPGVRTERQRYLQRFVMARLADHAGRIDAALPLLVELDAATQTVRLVRWEPSLAFEVKQQLIKALRSVSLRKDADKPTLAHRIDQLQGELTVLDPTRALAL